MEDMYNRLGKGDIVICTNDRLSYFFKKYHYEISNDSLYGSGYKRQNENSNLKVLFNGSIPLSNIDMIKQDELNPGTTTLFIVGGIVFIVTVVYIIELFNSFQHI